MKSGMEYCPGSSFRLAISNSPFIGIIAVVESLNGVPVLVQQPMR